MTAATSRTCPWDCTTPSLLCSTRPPTSLCLQTRDGCSWPRPGSGSMIRTFGWSGIKDDLHQETLHHVQWRTTLTTLVTILTPSSLTPWRTASLCVNQMRSVWESLFTIQSVFLNLRWLAKLQSQSTQVASSHLSLNNPSHDLALNNYKSVRLQCSSGSGLIILISAITVLLTSIVGLGWFLSINRKYLSRMMSQHEISVKF